MDKFNHAGKTRPADFSLFLRSEDPRQAFENEASPQQGTPLAHELYHALVENSLGLICVHDTEGVLRYVNPAAAHSLGYRPEEGVGRNLREFMVESVRHLFDIYLQRITSSGKDTGMMRLFTRTGSERIWLYRNVMVDGRDGERLILGHALDVTDLKRTKDALRESFRQLESVFNKRSADVEFSNNILRLEVAERRRMEEMLRRQALTFQHISDAVTLSDENGNFIDWNPAAERIFGYTNVEARGRGASIVDPPENSAEITAKISAGLAKEHHWAGELPFQRKDGTRGTRELTVLPVHDEEGRHVATIGVNRDITDAKNAEHALRESEELFRLTIENASDVVMILDTEANIQFVSPSVEQVLGYKPAELLGSSGYTLLREDQLDRVRTLLLQRIAMGAGNEAHHELACRHKDGSCRVLELIGRPFVDRAKHTRLVLNARDVTERHKFEESMRLSEERYRSLFERNLAGVLHSNIDGKLIQWNHAFEQILGYTTQEMRHLSAADMYYDLADHDGYVEALLAQRSINNHELCFRTKRGQRVWVLANATLIDNDNGGPQEIIGSVVDITERRQLEEQLRHSQKMDAIGRLAGGVAHDFNNLLTVISGYSDIVMDSLEPGDPMNWQILEIKKAADRASSLTRQLLSFSRRQLIEPSVLDLNNVVAGVHNMLRRVIGEDIELVTILHGTPGWIRADTGQVEQVLVNLVVNARDAMPTGGKLTIELTMDELFRTPRTSAPDVQPGRYVVLTVGDTGCGMDSETLNRIFEPFFTTKERGKGTGLGLSTVYGIVKQGGGHIHVSSEVGRGTTFRIYFPLAEESSEKEPEIETYTNDADGTETVLVVEDETLVRRMVRQILERHGYKVLEACDGHEALALLAYQHRSIDLILTDAVMPHLNGRQLVEQVAPLYPNIKIMYMSGYTDEALHGMPSERTVAFLAKPFTPEVLVRKLRSVLDKVPGTGD